MWQNNLGDHEFEPGLPQSRLTLAQHRFQSCASYVHLPHRVLERSLVDFLKHLCSNLSVVVEAKCPLIKLTALPSQANRSAHVEYRRLHCVEAGLFLLLQNLRRGCMSETGVRFKVEVWINCRGWPKLQNLKHPVSNTTTRPATNLFNNPSQDYTPGGLQTSFRQRQLRSSIYDASKPIRPLAPQCRGCLELNRNHPRPQRRSRRPRQR